VNDGEREIKVLGKPYTRDQLAQAVREALHRCIEGAGGRKRGGLRIEPSTVTRQRQAQRLR
jgi:hypothetical protein